MISVFSCDIKHWSNGHWKFSFAILKINYILIYIQFFFLFYNITVLLFYLSHKCSLGEQKKTYLKKSLTNIFWILMRNKDQNIFLYFYFKLLE